MNTRQLDLINKQRNSEMSSGERTVSKFLTEKNIRFEREYFIEEFINKSTGYHLFFDFFLIDLNIAIEVDGIYHFKPVNGIGELLYQKQRDNLKNKYCKRNGIKLLRVRYDHGKVRVGKLERLLIDLVKKNPATVFKPKPPKKKKNHKTYREIKKDSTVTRLKASIATQTALIEKKRQEARKNYPPDILEKLKNRS